MIAEEIKNIDSGISSLRKFGVTMGIILALLGAIFLWKGRDWYSHLFILSVGFLLFGLVFPILLRPIYKGWMTLSILMGWVMSRVILCILFYLIITPIGFLLRVCGKDILGLKFRIGDTDSYWMQKRKTRSQKSDYEKQF